MITDEAILDLKDYGVVVYFVNENDNFYTERWGKLPTEVYTECRKIITDIFNNFKTIEVGDNIVIDANSHELERKIFYFRDGKLIVSLYFDFG